MNEKKTTTTSNGLIAHTMNGLHVNCSKTDEKKTQKQKQFRTHETIEPIKRIKNRPKLKN